jgi:biotin transport system substrate-specific component
MLASQVSIRKSVLAGIIWPGAGVGRSIALIVAGSLLLTLSAKIQIPFWPVPMTMQTLAVLVLGAAYGARLGVAAMLTYIAEGAAGLPVFAGPSAGAAYLMGPTAGYLVGFVIAAGVVGFLAERGWNRRMSLIVGAMCLGHLLIFVPGVLWLAVLFGWQKAFAVGVSPFVLATLLKTALAAALLRGLWSAGAGLSRSR